MLTRAATGRDRFPRGEGRRDQDSGLLPKVPVERARVRFFITVSIKLFPSFVAFFYRGESPDTFVAAVAEIQELLLPAAQFTVRDHFTITDAALAPFLGRWELQLRNDVGKFTEGTNPRKYFANVSGRESFKNSFDSEYLLARAKIRFAQQ
ncbi:hypothetical protein EDB84DRAFT_1440346 [Lactarius hengduanensis]|nr:hypothetical protein EDB84DRAFT_1440346 [Lactarius hengduanensis]